MITAVGLGNPGKKYESTRHNLGFQVVDRLAELFQLTGWERKFDALLAPGRLENRRFLLVKPQTYMNDSGRAVQAVLHFYKIPLEKLLVIVDDLDMEVGKIRQRTKGSDGGHRGLRSISQCLGTQGFNRIRIGIGRPPPGQSVISRVLRKTVDPLEAEKLAAGIETAARSAANFITSEEFEHWSSG